MPDQPKEVVNFRLDVETYDQLEHEAEQLGLSTSAYLRQIVNNRGDSHAELEDRVDRLEKTVRVLQEHVLDEE